MKAPRRLAAAALTSALLGLSARPALGHAVLLESRPGARETLMAAHRLDLRFHSRIEPAFSEVRLSGPAGQDVRLHAVVSESVGPNRLTAPLPPLGPGLYTVQWRVFTVDGHVSHGRFSFQIAEHDRER